MSIPFLSNITIDDAGHIQFKTAAGANAGKIDQDGNNLVLTNAVGDILLGDGSSDVYIGDGTNNVDIIFEQSGSIKGDGSAVTLTLGGANTTLNLENPNINGTLSLGATTINNKLTFTTANGYILFDYEPPGDTGEYSTETPLLKVQFDTGGGESTILSRISEYRAVVLGVDDTVWLRAGDTGSVIKANVNLVNEVVLMSAEQGFHAYAFPNNDTTWSNRNEFRFYGGSATASDNGLYIGDGGNTQFIDLSRNLKNIGTISSGAITSTGKIQGTELEGTSLDINGNADIAGELQVTTNGTATLILRGDNNNSGDTGQLDSAIKMLHDDGTHGILMETKNYAGKQSFEIKSLSAGTESSRFKIHEDNYILTTGNLVVQDTTTQPLSSIFHGTLVVKGSTSEDPIIAITDSGTANAAAGVFHQSSTSPGFPALVINAASDHSNTPLISARTNVSNTTGVGGTEVFKLEGDGDATFAGTLTVGGADAITIPDYILHAGDDSKFGFPSNDNFKVRLAGSDVFTMSTTSATFAGDLQAGGVYVGATNSSYDLYNNGTSYFNGAVTIDHNLDMTSNGVIKMGGTEVISATRNLNLYSRITFDYGGDHYFEAGTNTLAYKDSTGGSIMTLNASTQAATFSGDITLGANYIGRDGDNYIGFATDNLIKFRVNGATQVKLSDGVFAPQTDSDVDLGSNSTRFANVYADTLYGDGSNLTGITATDNTKLPLAGGSMTGDLNFNSSTKITHSQTGGVFDLNSNSNRVYLQTNHPTIKFQIDNDNTSNDSELFAINISTASPAPLSLTGSGLTLGSGNIILSGTGRIQGIDTVTDSTDAASKNYVDTEISNLLESAPEDLNTLNELA